MGIGHNDYDERIDSRWRSVGGIIYGAIIGSSGMGWIIGNTAGSERARGHGKCSSLFITVSAATQKDANQ